MEQKYIKGQKVRIRRIGDECLKVKYSHLQDYISKRGTMTESHWYGIDESCHLEGQYSHIKGHYIYDVRLDRGRKILFAVPEVALEPVN